MKMKTTKFLAVLAVLAMAFAVLAASPAFGSDATEKVTITLGNEDISDYEAFNYAESTKTLTIVDYEGAVDAYVFKGTDITVTDEDSNALSDAQIAALGLIVKKTVNDVSCYSDTMSGSAAAITASNLSYDDASDEANIIHYELLGDLTEIAPINFNKGKWSTTVDSGNYYVIDVNLGGYTLVENEFTAGQNTNDKAIRFGDNVIASVYNGTLKCTSDLSNTNPNSGSPNDRISAVFLQSYGQVTYGDLSDDTTLTIDLSEMKAYSDKTYFDFGIFAASGTVYVSEDVTIKAPSASNFIAVSAHYSTSTSAYKGTSGNGSLTEDSTVGSLIILNGASITGNVATTIGDNCGAGLSTVMIGAMIAVGNDTSINGNITDGLIVDRDASTESQMPVISEDEDAKYSTIAFGDFELGSTYTLTVNNAIVVGPGESLNANVEFVDESAILALMYDDDYADVGGAFVGTVAYDGSAADLSLRAGENGLAIAPGSIKIAGEIDSNFPGSSIEQTKGTVELGDAETDVDVTGSGVLGLGGNITVAGDLNIDSDADEGTTVYTVEDSVITIADGKKIIVNENGIFSVDGTVKAASTGADAGTIVNNGTVKESSNATVTAAISGAGTVVEEGDMEEIEVTGTSIQHTAFPAFQTVIVKDSWTLGTGTTKETCADITINGKLIVPAGATLTVKAGAVLKIDSDAKFIIEGTLVVEDGDIIGDVTFKAGKIEINNGTMTVSGTVSDNGWIDVANTMDVIVEPLGSFVIEDSGRLTTGSEATFVVSAGAELKIKGDFGNAEVYNFGYVLVDSEFPATTASAVYQMYDGATVEVKEYTIDAFYYNAAKLTISDYGMILFEYRADKQDKTFVRNENSETVEISMSQLDAAVTAANTYTISFSGLKAISNVTTKASTTEKDESNRIYNYVQYNKEMDIQGNLNVSYAYIGNSTSEATYEPKATVAVGGSVLVVTEDINIYDGVTFSVVSGGAITVTGDIDTSSSDAKFAANAEASVTVKGEGSISSTGAAVISETGMNAAKIVIPVADLTGKIVKIYTYLSVDAALNYINADGSEITEAVVLGNQTLTATNYVDAGDTLIVNGTLTIGKTGTTDVVLTVKTGAKLKGTGSIAVNGTLYAENKTNVSITAAKISSDVYACEKNEAGKEVGNGWAMWTNIATAIAEAEIGETVTLKQDAKLYSNLLIPSYVIVDVPNGKTLTLDDGVTLTIDGVLMVEGDVKAQTAFDLVAKKITTGTKAYSSTIVVNGALMTTGTVVYNDGKVGGTSGTGKSIYHADGAPIAGAYYSVKKYNVISDLSDALINIDSILDDIVLNGKIVEGDLVFDASKNCVKITLSGALHKDASNNTIVNSLTVDSITLVDGAALVIDTATNVDNNVFTGKVIIGETAVVVTGLTTKDANVEFKANLSGVFEISGAASIIDKGDAITVSSGLVNLNGFTVDQATKGVKIADKDANYDYTTNFTVSADALVNSNNATNTIVNMIVNGAVTVPAGMGLTVTNITVKGSVVVADATATAAKGNLTLGAKQEQYVASAANTHVYGKAYFGTAGTISDAATLFGPFTPYADGTNGGLIMYLYAGTETNAAADAVLDEMYSTELYANGALWATLYSSVSTSKEKVSVSVENAKFVGWNSSATATTGDETVTIGDKAKLYAIIDYNIYNVTIYTDAGVKSVSIDGIELKNDQTNVYSTVFGLVAGTHTVTYTLKSDYEGTPTLATMTGTILKDNKFATAGTTTAEKNLSFQLMGTEPVPEPEPTPTPEEKSEWTVTTILLCVLVVLIAIMAVIVALRLNRN